MAAEGSPWSILVVDDEENLNWSLVHSLRKEGYAADGAATGAEAQRRLAESRYDCIISDVMMPGMDGFELLMWIRRRQPSAQVIMMTAFGSPTSKQEALNNGVVAYLEKPFDLRILKDMLANLAQHVPAEAAASADEYDLLDVAQVLALAKRDMGLTVSHAGLAGRLCFLQGELVWAEYGEQRGDDAFLALGTTRAVRMRPEPWDGRGERNVTQPLSRLTYLALARREGRPTAPATKPLPAVSAPQAAGEDTDNGGTVAPQPALVTGPLAAVTRELPQPCGAAVLRLDGTVLDQAWEGRTSVPLSVFTHLGQAALAASRGALVGDFGSMEEMILLTSEWRLVVRRIGRGDRALLLMVFVAHSADQTSLGSILDAHATTLAELSN